MHTTARGHRKRSVLFVSFFAFVLVLPAAGNASNAGDSAATQSTSQATAGQNGGSDSQSGLAEIVVTAQKRTERLQDVPMSMSVISGDRLTATQSTTLQDIANSVPGLQAISSSPAVNTLVIRGINTGAGINASVATYVDEVPYTSAGPFSYSANIAPNFDPYDLARVEVLRGPQGTLYGASALSGLLKYVTNAPDPSGFSASFLAGGNHVDHGGAGYELHGMVNIPLGPTAAFRLTGSDAYFPGYVDDPSRGKENINGVRRENARASFLWKPTDDLSVRLTAAYQRLTAGDINDEDLDVATLRPIYGDLTHVRKFSQPQRVSNEIFNSTINWNLGFASLTSSTSWTKVDPYVFSDASASFGPVLDSIFGGNLGAAVVAREPVHSLKQELRLASVTQQPLEWTVGAYYDDETAHEFEPLYAADLNTGQLLPNFQPPLGAYFIDSTYREYAAFADVNYHLTSAFEVGAGGRYSKNKQTYHQVNNGFFTGINDFGTESDQSVTTYSVDTKYRFTPGLMAYARVATGYVPGGPNDVIPGSHLPSTFESSSTTNYELGIKASADEERISYDVDVFEVEWKRIQLFAQFGNLVGISNGGTARSRGLEGTFTFRPIKELTLMLNGAYTDARLTEDTPASFGGHDGDRLPLSPFFAGTVAAEYERPIGSNVSAFGGIEWHYNGSRIAPFNSGGPRADLPGYSMVDLRTGVKVHRYTITAYVKNVGDVRAINTVFSETVAGRAALDANVGMPRTIGLTVSATF
jgi:iron complex outermembrane receptor protein